MGLDGRVTLDAITEYHMIPWESGHTLKSDEPRRSQPPRISHLGGSLSPPSPEGRSQATLNPKGHKDNRYLLQGLQRPRLIPQLKRSEPRVPLSGWL